MRLRYACHFSGLGSATVASHDGDFVAATNVRIWPITATESQQALAYSTALLFPPLPLLRS